jgi:hypothetical protein
MKPVTTLLALLVAFFFAGCQKKMCTTVRTISVPVWKTRAELRSGMHPGPAQPIAQTGKLYLYGSFIFMSEPQKGIHIIDNSNPASPVNKAFIPVPGNVDLAVKDNYLYADSWSDLVVFDLADLNNIQPVHFLNDVFPQWSFNTMFPGGNDPNAALMLAGYTEHDTVVACGAVSYDDVMPVTVGVVGVVGTGISSGGTGGSMARFALVQDHLYAVTSNNLSSISLANPAQPQADGLVAIGNQIETVYPLGSRLFIGTATGMLIYDVSSPSSPAFVSRFDHATACDPVIADGQHAYVTLRSGTSCNSSSNELNVVSITNITTPQLLRSYPMTSPHGLAKDGNLLFICDGRDGLRLLDATNPANISELQHLAGIDSYDAIAQNGILVVVAANGLYQYDYRSGNRLQLLSQVPVQP